MSARPSHNRRQASGFVRSAGGLALAAGVVAIAWPQPARATVYTLQANLDQLQEGIAPTPGKIPPAGVAMVRYDDVTNTFLTVQSAFDGLTLDPANTTFPRVLDSHFHFGDPGVQGPIRVPNFGTNYTETTPGFLRGDFTNVVFTRAEEESSPGSGRTLEQEMLANRFYYNVHSNQHPVGEIRGQLIVVVPEPASVALLGLAAGAGLLRRRR